MTLLFNFTNVNMPVTVDTAPVYSNTYEHANEELGTVPQCYPSLLVG